MAAFGFCCCDGLAGHRSFVTASSGLFLKTQLPDVPGGAAKLLTE
jgi:hypothetical protein